MSDGIGGERERGRGGEREREGEREEKLSLTRLSLARSSYGLTNSLEQRMNA